MCCGYTSYANSSFQKQPPKTKENNQMLKLNTRVRRTNVPTDPRFGNPADHVMARYVGGKGCGKHYYEGRASRYSYLVKYSEIYQVHKDDAMPANSPLKVSQFVYVGAVGTNTPTNEEQLTVPHLEVSQPEPVVVEEEPEDDSDLTNELGDDIEDDEVIEDEEQELVTVSDLSLPELKQMDISSELASLWLAEEKANKKRKKHVEYLQSLI